MCKDCKEYFQKMAMSENKEYITADPTVIRIFNTDGTITEINR